MVLTTRVVTVICDIATVTLLITFSFLVRRLAVPFYRGFNPDDESIMYPYKQSTITTNVLYSVGLIMPSLIILLVEAHRVCYQRSDYEVQSFTEPSSKLRAWLYQCYPYLLFFFFGFACTNIITNVSKYVIGRLRPNFVDVCQPDWSKINISVGYITENVCTSTDIVLIEEARLSFPSGHSSISMYCMCYAILYLQRNWPYGTSYLLQVSVQYILFMGALYTGFSRITDYKHHWSDVLAGFLLGATFAWLIVFKECFRQQPVQKSSSNAGIVQEFD